VIHQTKKRLKFRCLPYKTRLGAKFARSDELTWTCVALWRWDREERKQRWAGRSDKWNTL